MGGKADEIRHSSGSMMPELRHVYYTGAWAAVESICERLISENPADIFPFLIWAEAAIARGNLAAARSRLRRAARLRFPDLDSLLRLIRFMSQAGDWPALRQVVGVLAERSGKDPKNFNDVFALGFASDAIERVDDAISAYERAIALVPANAAPHTFRANLLFRRAWGSPLPAPAQKQQPQRTRGRLAMNSLGLRGRFGNQLFQYGYLRIYGQVHGLRVEVPDWIGRWLHDLDDPYPGGPLILLEENPEVMGELLQDGSKPILADRDLMGYCQCHTRHFRPHQALLRALFQPGVRLRPSVERALDRLRERGSTLVALHLRRGDYAGGEFFWSAPAAWYLDWLRLIWPTLKAPVLYVASDDPQIHREFSEFSPVSAADIGEVIPGAEMYPDFHILTQADLLAISNSSFSVMAAMLNERARSLVRPHPNEQRLVLFDPWDTDVLWRSTGAASSGRT